MGRLIFSSMSYRAGLAGYALLMALALAAAANLVLPAIGLQPDPADDFKLPFLLPVFVLFASLVVAVGAQVGDSRERHQALQALLPLTASQIGGARALAPALTVVSGLVLAELLMLAILVVMGIELAAWRFLFLSYFAGQFLILGQLPSLLTELREEIKRSPLMRTLLSAAIILVLALFLLRTLSRYLEIDPAVAGAVEGFARLDPESPASSLAVHGLGWALVLANFLLLRRRRSWI